MKKIMFSDKYSLTEAVLEGRKTQTRRIVSEKLLDKWTNYDDFCNSVCVGDISITRQYFNENDFFFDNSHYKFDEIVAIAQRYKDIVEKRDEAQEVLDLYKIGEKYLTMEEMGAGWSNKMFVAADLMPHHIRITNVRVERLQDISDEDCLREGIEERRDPYLKELEYGIYNGNKPILLKPTPRDAYAALIDKISGKGIFQSNPFVFVYEFELVD